MSKVVFEGQPELNADEEKLVEILGDDGLSQMLEHILTDSGFDSLQVFDVSGMDDIDFDNINFDNVVLATVIGYERAVKEVAGTVKTELFQIAKDYEDIQERD